METQAKAVKNRFKEEDARQTLQEVTKLTWQPERSENARCTQCEEEQATRFCLGCDRLLCTDCFLEIHKDREFRAHTFQTVSEGLIDKVSSHFNWPEFRQVKPGVAITDAYRDAAQAVVFEVCCAALLQIDAHAPIFELE